MGPIQIFTIGFTQKTAEEFFTLLRAAGVRRIVDVRLNNTSQLAGFAKRDNLIYFLRELIGVDYVHVPELAPTQEILTAYKKQKGAWDVFETAFLELMDERRVSQSVSKEIFHLGCLLCSEHDPNHCHRRLVAEHLSGSWGNVTVNHLK